MIFFQNGCLFAEYDPFKPTIFIQNFIHIDFRINLKQISRDRNTR